MQQKNKKKILFVLQLPPPVHGASMMNKHVVESRLLAGNFETSVINLQFARNMQEIEKFNFRKLFRVFSFAWDIVRAISRDKPDLIYFTFSPRGFAFYRDLLYAFLFKFSSGKVVYHLHGKGLDRTANRNGLNFMLCRWAFKNAGVICLSEKLTKDIKNIYDGVPYTVPNGIAGLPYLKGERVSSPETVPNILYLSNYIREKGVLVLIDALKILHDQGHRFTARLVGAPSELSIEYLKAHLLELGLEKRVEVVGPRYAEEKTREFQQADLFVFPTFYANEAFPLVNLEAMQFGLPVISTNEGGIPDMLLEEETGFIVEAQNAPMLAEKIAILLTDRNLRADMGEKAAAHFSQYYTLAHFERNLNEVFQDLLGLPKAPRKIQTRGVQA